MIVVDKVSKYYGAHRAVADLDFVIREGECIGFLGLNGAGKSTTLRLLSCLLLPTSGRIRVRDLDVVTHPHEIRRFIGYLPDTPPLYPEMTVREYLEFAGKLRGLAGSDLNAGLDRASALCSLRDVAHAPISQLSHGYRQRVGIAQAIIHRPSLLILDEPIQGLDPVQIVEMRKMIGELRGEHTILLSTHILTEIEATCDRILVMHEGRVAAQGTEQELAAQLSARSTLQLEVRGSADALRQALAGLPISGEPKIELQSSGLVHAALHVDDGHREAISRAVVQAGLGLIAMYTEATGLESLFLQLSSRASAAKNDGAAAPGARSGARPTADHEARP